MTLEMRVPGRENEWMLTELTEEVTPFVQTKAGGERTGEGRPRALESNSATFRRAHQLPQTDLEFKNLQPLPQQSMQCYPLQCDGPRPLSKHLLCTHCSGEQTH